MLKKHLGDAFRRRRARTHDLAVVYGQRGQYREARIRYLQALDRDPAFAPAHHNLGNIHFRRGEMAAAEQRFRRALQADSTYALAHLGLGNVQMLRKQYERAIASFRRGPAPSARPSQAPPQPRGRRANRRAG